MELNYVFPLQVQINEGIRLACIGGGVTEMSAERRDFNPAFASWPGKVC
jgi:hypothetical protein